MAVLTAISSGERPEPRIFAAATARLVGLLVLLVSAGLLIRSVARLEGIDPGFRSDRVATGIIALPTAR
jgi:hypothetical protein